MNFTKKYYDLTLSAFLTIVTLVFMLCFVAWASAASLRICVVDPPSDVTTAPVFINTNPLWPDLLPGSAVSASGRCNVIPIPAGVVRGVDQSITMKYTNALQEVSAASNAKTFSLPPSPVVPIINSVQIVVP